MSLLLLIRHGEAEGNAAGLVMGCSDLPLTPRGRAQAQALGLWLARRGVAPVAAYASDLSRAAETARILSATVGGGPKPPLHLRPDLREVGRGALEGRTYAEAAELSRLPEVRQTFEPAEAVAARLRRAAAELRAAAALGHVAAVAHGGSLSVLLRILVGASPAGGPADAGFSFSNTGLTALDCASPRPRILCVNALYHLDGPPPW